ncbi:MAG: glycosyltransferase family 39 protein [Myxococcota bacterium]
MQPLAPIEAAPLVVPARPDGEGSARSLRIGLALGLGLALAGLVGLAMRISLARAFAVDEFAYAHAGWMIAQGAVPHLDFFETKFSGPLWLFSIVFALGGDDPHLIGALRIFCWLFVAVVVAGVGLVNRRIHPLAPLATAVVLLANPVFTNTAIEIRPDTVALAFLVAALVLIGRADTGRRAVVGLAIGVLLGLSAVCSAKVSIYASPLALVWLLERRPGSDRAARLFRAPFAVAAGFAAVLVGSLGLLVGTGSLEAFIAQAIAHNRQFLVGERWRPWQLDVQFVLMNAPWLHALALVGLAGIVRPEKSASRETDASGEASADRAAARARRMDLVLAAMLATAFASHAIQLYPFLYSLLPFMALEAIFAGRGLVGIVRWIAVWPAAPLRRLVAVGLAGWSAIGIAMGAALLAALGAPSNQGQRALFDEIERVSGPGDAIYDNSGSYVARRSAYFLPWTDAPIRALWAEKLVQEVPRAIEASECVVAVVDERFGGLPPALQGYLQAHFKPWSGSVLLWGADFAVRDGAVEGEFVANRSGTYRIQPAEVATSGGLSIDGRPVSGEVVELARGSHAVAYRGNSEGFRLQWLPGDRRLAAR